MFFKKFMKMHVLKKTTREFHVLDQTKHLLIPLFLKLFEVLSYLPNESEKY